MYISNIVVNRCIAHEVVRASDFIERPPILSDAVIELNENGKKLVEKRLVDSVSSGSHSVDVQAENSSIGSSFNIITSMLDSVDADFVKHSKELARALSRAQTTGPIKSGSVLFVQGTCVSEEKDKRFIAVIKADSDQGFFKNSNGENEVTLTFVSDMILGESQRLIKIGFFLEDLSSEEFKQLRDVEDFSIKIFDHLLQNSGQGQASLYFYKVFLECKLAESSSRNTLKFYEEVCKCINTLNIDQSEKINLRGDVISYLRGNRATINIRTFVQEVIPEVHKDVLIQKLKAAEIPDTISKDLSLLKGKMKRQSMKFSSKVILFASPEVLRESIRNIVTTEDGWTRIEIKGVIEET